MKKFSYIIITGLVILLLSAQWGCRKADSFLDAKVTNDLNEAAVFADSARTMDFLAGIYAGEMDVWINTGSPNTQDGPWDEVTDEASTRWPGANNVPNQVFDGLFATQFLSRIEKDWTHLYNLIRQANIYLNDVDEAPLSEPLKQRTKAEARFLRAYCYSLLINGWGGIPLVGDKPFGLSDANEISRSTYADCVDYIVSQLDDIAPQLPLSYSGLDYGRITRGACMALKARVLLFAASPLYNGGGPSEDPEVKKLLSYPTYDAQRWQKALTAIQDVVDLGTYHLEKDNDTKPGYGFYRVFLKRMNNEYILARMYGPNKDVEQTQLPPSRGGDYRRYPTQELVDAFPMKNGVAIDTTTDSYKDNPYADRDPRFYYTIIYNGAPFFSKTTNQLEPIWTYVGAKSDGLKAVTANTGTNTGYYVRKMMDELVAANGTATTERCLPVIRYAEILLNLAEAANETGDTHLAMDQLIALRDRAGIEPGTDGRYGLPADPDQNEARELIRNERFIELAFEMHRFWDLKRWKAGDWLDGQMMHGMKITKSGDDFIYERINERHRYFKDKIYYFPIPQSEISINRALLQNPGW